jgi:ribosome-binding factor A
LNFLNKKEVLHQRRITKIETDIFRTTNLYILLNRHHVLISRVKLNTDFSNITLFCIPTDKSKIEKMREETTLLKQFLSQKLNLRKIPTIKIIIDQDYEKSLSLDLLIDELSQ